MTAQHEKVIDQLVQVIAAAVDMRVAQVAYFKRRTSADLIASKNAEKEFDRLAASVVGLVSTHKKQAAAAALQTPR